MDRKQNDKKQVFRELLIFAVGQLICLGLTFGVYALLKRLTGKVLLGGALGALLAMLNYFLLAVGVFLAADKAEKGDVRGARGTVSLSMALRYLLMIGVLVAAALSGYFDVIAMVIPLLLGRLIVSVGEFFRKKDGDAG